MAKQLLHKKNVDKLSQLDSGFFTYVVDGYKVDIFVSKDKLEGRGLDDFYSKDYTEYSVYINDKQVFYKKKGYKGGGYHSFDYEIFDHDNYHLSSDLKDSDSGILYSNGIYSLQDYSIWKTSDQNRKYKVRKDIINGPSCAFYVPSKNEYGVHIAKDVDKIIENPEEKAFEKIRKIYDDYNETADEVYGSVIKTIQDNVASEKLLPIREEEIEELKKKLYEILFKKVGDRDIRCTVDTFEEIKDMYLAYQSMNNSKKFLHQELLSFNNILEKCLDLAIKDKEGYESELEAAKKALKIKYNKK